MLHVILQYLSHIFPHTTGRLAYWHSLLFYDNTGLFDLHNIIIAILPTCMYYLDVLAYAGNHNDQNDHEVLLEPRPSPLRTLNDCTAHWLVVHGTLNLIATLDLALRASGFWGKILLAIDLIVEKNLVFLATRIIFFAVGVFVVAAIEKSPFVEDLFIMAWVAIKVVLFDEQDPIEADFDDDDDDDEAP